MFMAANSKPVVPSSQGPAAASAVSGAGNGVMVGVGVTVGVAVGVGVNVAVGVGVMVGVKVHKSGSSTVFFGVGVGAEGVAVLPHAAMMITKGRQNGQNLLI